MFPGRVATGAGIQPLKSPTPKRPPVVPCGLGPSPHSLEVIGQLLLNLPGLCFMCLKVVLIGLLSLCGVGAGMRIPSLQRGSKEMREVKSHN